MGGEGYGIRLGSTADTATSSTTASMAARHPTPSTVLSFDVGLRNLAYCELDMTAQSTVPHLRRWELIDVLETSSQKRLTTIAVSVHQLLKCLQRIFHQERQANTLKPVLVLIEQQPAMGRCQNMRMKVLSHALQSFFILSISNCEVRFVSPRQKLPAALVAKRARKSYAGRKEASIQLCRRVLMCVPEWTEHWLPVFESARKKDDLADCLLQVLVHLKVTPSALAGFDTVAPPRKPSK